MGHLPKIRWTIAMVAGHTFVWRWSNLARFINAVGAAADNPDLPLNWRHAAELMRDARQRCESACGGK
jgi:hypothetical protein